MTAWKGNELNHNAVPAIGASNVSVRYGDVVALDHVTFAVPEGAFVAVIGRNGAGKTTLLHVMLGLISPSEGEMSVFGRPVPEVDKRLIGYVPQIKTWDRTFPATVLDLVISGHHSRWPWRISKDAREAALEALKHTDMAHLADAPLARLSGGELQRVYFARAVLKRPRLMILDEPATGMDIAGEAEMYHILERYQRASNCTIFMVTHDWEGARYHASHVLLLDRRVLEFGPPSCIGGEEQLLRLFGHTGHAQRSHARVEV
jgi:zinc transport system ATP-binding protein